jgi:uncharacterized membrane protein
MAEKKETHLTRLMGTIRNQFLIGLAVSVPLVVTILVLSWLFNTIDSILQPIIRVIFGQSLPGVGLIVTIIIIYLAGIISSNVVGRQLIRFGERLVYRVPIVRTVYSSVKQVVDSFSSNGKSNFLQVVLVEYPRKGVMSLAFVTSETCDRTGRKLLSLLIPTAPNPLSGYVIVVPEEEIVRTSMKMDAAMRMIISCGAILPPESNNGKPLTNWPPEFSCQDTKASREEKERQDLESNQNSDR